MEIADNAHKDVHIKQATIDLHGNNYGTISIVQDDVQQATRDALAIILEQQRNMHLLITAILK